MWRSFLLKYDFYDGFYIEHLVQVLLLVLIYQYRNSKRDLFHSLWATVLHVHLPSGRRLCIGPCHIGGWKVCCNVNTNNTGNVHVWLNCEFTLLYLPCDRNTDFTVRKKKNFPISWLKFNILALYIVHNTYIVYMYSVYSYWLLDFFMNEIVESPCDIDPKKILSMVIREILLKWCNCQLVLKPTIIHEQENFARTSKSIC